MGRLTMLAVFARMFAIAISVSPCLGCGGHGAKSGSHAADAGAVERRDPMDSMQQTPDAAARADADGGAAMNGAAGAGGMDDARPSQPAATKGSKPNEPNTPAAADGGSRSDAGASEADAGEDTHDARCSVAARQGAADAPTIWLVIDGSGSMIEMLGDKTRWDAMKAVLMDPSTGLVKTLEHDVKWGMLMYDGPLPEGTEQLLPDGSVRMFSSAPATTCPRDISVAPKLNNFADIAAAYSPDPLGGSTPTDKALESLLPQLPDAASSSAPISIVLATDGAPNDFCSMVFPPADVAPRVIADVKMLAARDVKTYVISLAGDDQMLMQHLTDVAKSGATGQAPFTPQNSAELLAAVRAIAVHDPDCDLKLDARIPLLARCDADVQLGSTALACDGPDGFSVESPSTLRLSGSACTHYKADPSSLRVDVSCRALQGM